MKKIVVVVRVAAGLANREVTFEGENLEVIDRSASTTDYNKLVITENSEKKHTIAVFREWVYWYEKKDEAELIKTIKEKTIQERLKEITEKFQA